MRYGLQKDIKAIKNYFRKALLFEGTNNLNRSIDVRLTILQGHGKEERLFCCPLHSSSAWVTDKTADNKASSPIKYLLQRHDYLLKGEVPVLPVLLKLSCFYLVFNSAVENLLFLSHLIKQHSSSIKFFIWLIFPLG